MGLTQGEQSISGEDGIGEAAGVVTDVSGDRRLQVETIITSPAGVLAFFRGPLVNSGGSDNQIVDGSSTAIVFSLVADPTNDTILTELRIVFSADALDWDGASIGRGSGLTSGILIELVQGVTTTEISNVKINEDWLLLPARNDVLVDQISASAVLAISVDFGTGITLEAGSGDLVRSTVRDNLAFGPLGLASLRMITFGTMA